MSGFFGAGAIQGGVVLGNLLGKGGFFGPIFNVSGGGPPGTPMLITFGGPNSNGPWNPVAPGYPFGESNDFGAYSNTGATTGGALYGSLDSGSGLVNGVTLEALGWSGDPGPGGAFVVVLGPTGTIAQNFFTSVTIGAPVSLTLTTVTASYFNSNDAVAGFPGYTVWAWAHNPVATFAQVSVSFT